MITGIKQFSLVLLLLVALQMTLSAKVQPHTLVLVTNSDLDLDSLSIAEIRKLYLGFPVYQQDHAIDPLINRTTPILYEVFLQKIVFLSSRSYQRRLKAKVYRSGSKKLTEISDQDRLLSTLASRANTLTFMWLTQAKAHKLKKIRTIWQGVLE